MRPKLRIIRPADVELELFANLVANRVAAQEAAEAREEVAEESHRPLLARNNKLPIRARKS